MRLFDLLKRVFGIQNPGPPSEHRTPTLANPIDQKFSDVGRLDPVCPHCSATLKKMPGRKTKCPACGLFMFVRTRPRDRRRVLVTEKDAALIEQEWGRIHDRTRLLGPDTSLPDDQIWDRCNRELIAYSRVNDWGLYRNTRLKMACLLRLQGRLRPALDTYFEVLYLDINGCRNAGGCGAISKSNPPFVPESAVIPIALVDDMRQIAAAMDLNSNQVEGAFLKTARHRAVIWRAPVSPEAAWQNLKIELNALSNKTGRGGCEPTRPGD